MLAMCICSQDAGTSGTDEPAACGNDRSVATRPDRTAKLEEEVQSLTTAG